MDTQRFLRSRHLGLAGAVATLATATVLAQARGGARDSSFIWYTLGVGLLASMAPSAMVFLLSSVDRIGELAAEISGDSRKAGRVLQPLKIVSSGAFVFPAVVGVVVAGLFSTEFFGMHWQGLAGVLFLVLSAVFFAAYAVVGSAYLACLMAAWSLPSQSVRSGIWSWPRAAIGDLYRTYFRLLLLGTALYLAAVTAVWSTPAAFWILRESWLARVWVVPPAIAIIMFFGSFHYATHSLLTTCKCGALNELDSALAAEYSRWLDGHSSERAEAVSALLKWREVVRAESEWCLDVKGVLVTLATVLLPTAKAVLDLVHG
jgi:hypothetical protein